MKKRKIFNLETFAEWVSRILNERDSVREKSLYACREMTRLSALAIRHIHQGKKKEAQILLRKAIKLLKETRKNLKRYPEIMYSGFLHAAEKEIIEGYVFLSIVKEQKLPPPEKHSLDTLSYLHGLAESVGEIRRYLLDKLRNGNIEDSKRYLAIMDDIYNFLISFHHNDSITRGLRKQVDYVRSVLEKTRSDVTHAVLLQRYSS